MKKQYLSLLYLFVSLCQAITVYALPVDCGNTRQAAGKYYCYPYIHAAPPALTPAPAGYEPFHIEHYGRHGSRWHIGYKNYDQAYGLMKKAHESAQLTSLGERVFKTISDLREKAHEGRSGELTEVGALQHQVIGRRMVENFPQVFGPDATVSARSTIVIRAILSMQNGLDAIRKLCPEIKISTDASNADMWYLYHHDDEAENISKSVLQSVLKEYKKSHPNKGRYLDKLIKSKSYSTDSIGDKLFVPLFYTLANCQSHTGQPWLMDSIFSKDEIWEQWLHDNADWFIKGGNSKLTENRMPFSQANLLMNIISSADSTFLSTAPSANLRYGHDSVLLPLTVLMEVDEFGKEINDLEELDESGWHDYLMVPMAANIQMIFYRRPGSRDMEDVLVKVLLNEREVRLPVGHVSGPYYNWQLLRNYYIDKISPFITSQPFQES